LDKTLTPIETALVNCLLRRQSQTMSELVNSLGTGVDFSTRTQLRESFHKLLKLFNTIIPGSINKQGQHNMTRYSLGHDVLGVDLRPENSTPWFTEETAELMQDDQPTEGIPEPTLEAPRIATLDFLANLIAKKLHAMQELASTVGSEALDKIVDPQEQQSSQDNQMARSGQSIEPEAAKIQLAPVERPARRVNRGRGQRVWTSAIFNGHDTLDDNVSFVASNNPIVSNIMYGTTLKISDLQDLPRLKLVLDHVASYSSIRTEGPIRDRYGKLYNLWLKLSQR